MKLTTTLAAALVLAAAHGAIAQDAGSTARPMTGAFGLITHTAEGREIPVPPGVKITFKKQGGGAYTFETQRPVDRMSADAQVLPKPVNYWARPIPAGGYKVHIRGEGFLPYNDPKTYQIERGTLTRIDFAGLRRRGVQAGTAASVSDGSSSAESPLAAAPAGGSAAAGGGTYSAQWIGWFSTELGKPPFKHHYAPGEKFRVIFKFKNTGTATWLTNTLPNQQGFVYPKQIGNNQFQSGYVVAQQTVAPGAIGRWTADVQCPDHDGTFKLRFRLHRGDFNQSAINDAGPFKDILVQSLK